ncbi:MAG TPA: hypothetical protein VFK26_06440 [Gemmatimonadaceae bacterium]|nr:hypothetical protein [Gemmatimonadaceae bacterium]
MTDPPARARSGHWLRAIVYGFLAEVATIITIIIVVKGYQYVIAPGQADPAYAAFGERAGGIIGIVGGSLFTFLFARLLMRRVSARQVAHGVVVAVAAIALSVGGSLAGHQGVPMGYIVASALKLGAGALAGILAARSAPATDA